MVQPASGEWVRRIGIPHAALLILLVALSGCDEPFVVLAGEELSGEIVDPPADWADYADVEIAQLETRPDDPYSVNIWIVSLGPDLYVATGEDDTRWTKHIDANPDVRVRIEGQIFELEATRIADLDEKRRAGTEYVSKYQVEQDDNWVVNGQLFRLDRR